MVLNSGDRFVETGSGAGALFLFNDTLTGSTVTDITATLDGVTQTTGPGNTFPGGFSGSTNLNPGGTPPGVHADGTGFFTASVQCTVASDCNGGSTPNINDLHFTVTNATLTQLETANANGNLFVADILCGQSADLGFGTCTSGGPTGPVDVSTPAPIVGAGLPGLIAACGGLIVLARRRRQLVV